MVYVIMIRAMSDVGGFFGLLKIFLGGVVTAFLLIRENFCMKKTVDRTKPAANVSSTEMGFELTNPQLQGQETHTSNA